MRNGEILTLYETLTRLSDNKTLKFPVPAGYALAKNKEKLRQEAQLIYEMRRKIVMEHGKLDGSNIVVPKEYIDDVNKKINELMEIETDINLITIPIDVFDGIELNIEDMEGLMYMITPLSPINE